MNVRVLMRAKDIPDSSIVTKRGGEKRYVLSRGFTVYPPQNHGTWERVSLDAGNLDQVFLLNGDTANMVPDETLLLWDVPVGTLHRHMTDG